MAHESIAPTKTNLQKLEEELAFAKQGYELLDQKRNILIMELMNLIDQCVESQRRIEKTLSEAFKALEDSVLTMGRLKVLNLTGGININCSINLKQRKVMGVMLPVVETDFSETPPSFSPYDTTSRIDDTMNSFKEVLEPLGRLAELKISVLRLADQVKKTIRKVNALEKIAIPDLTENVRYISSRLEENERDMFVMMKKVKERLDKKRS